MILIMMNITTGTELFSHNNLCIAVKTNEHPIELHKEIRY